MNAYGSRALRKRLRAAGLLAAVVLIVSSALSSGALCLGDDGHVALELTLAGKCLDDVSGRTSTGFPHGLSVLESASGCGPCTDLGTPSGAWLSSAVPDLPGAGPAVAFFPPAAVLTNSAKPSWVLATSAHSGVPLATLASTVIRC